MNRRIVVRVFAGVAALVVLLALAVVLVLPRVVNLASLREQVATQLSRQLKGVVELQSLSLAVLPLPHVVAEHVTVSIPGVASGTIASLSAYPRLLSLLRGTVQLDRVQLDQPQLSFELPPQAAASVGGVGVGMPTRDQVAAAVAALSTAMSAAAPDLVVSAHEATVALTRAGAPLYRFNGLDARVRLPPQRLTIDVTGDAEFWEHLTLSATLDPATLDGTAAIDVVGLKPLASQALRLPEPWPQLEGAEVTMAVKLSTVGFNTFEAEASGAIPSVTLVHGHARASLQCNRVAATIEHSARRTTVAVTALALQQPQLEATGTIVFDHETPRASIDLRGTAVDVGSVREFMTAMAGEVGVVAQIFNTLRGGTVSAITYRAEAASPIGWGASDAMTIDAVVIRGAVHVPGAEVDLEGASGRLAISGGVLTGADLEGRMGESRVHDGALRLALFGAAPELHMDASVEAHMVDVLAAVRHRLGEGTAEDLLAGLSDLRGDAAARVTIDGTIHSFQTRLEVDRSTLSGRVSGVKHPVQIEAGQFRYDLGLIAVVDATVRVGDAVFSSVNLDWSRNGLDLKRAQLRDAHSDASLAFRRTGREFGFAFAGTVTRATADDLLTDNRWLTGSVSGDIRVQARLDEPTRSTADGRLELSDLLIPAGAGNHLRVGPLAVTASGGTMHVDTTVEVAPASTMRLTGQVKASADAFVVDLDLAAGHVDWDTLAAVLPGGGDDATSPAGDVTPWPLRGAVRLAAESFSLRGFTWRPLRALVNLGGADHTVVITDANLCGIATPGRVGVTPEGLTLDVEAKATQQRLDQTLTCLGDDVRKVTGEYSLAGRITAQAPASEIGQALRGSIEFHAKSGRIQGMTGFAKVLSVVNVSVTELDQEGFPYDSITIEGDLRNGILALTKAVLDGPAAQMVGEGSIDILHETAEVTLLVAPLTRVDSVVSRVPVLGDILGGNLVTIPVKVRGPWATPEVMPLDPATVGDRLLGMMKRTADLPVELMSPLFPRGKRR